MLISKACQRWLLHQFAPTKSLSTELDGQGISSSPLLGGWRPFIYIQNSPSYRTSKIIEIHVVANLWRRLAAITLSGGKARHNVKKFSLNKTLLKSN